MGAAVAALILVGAAVALAAQSSPGTDELDERVGPNDEMHRWMTGDFDEMPSNT